MFCSVIVLFGNECSYRKLFGVLCFVRRWSADLVLFGVLFAGVGCFVRCFVQCLAVCSASSTSFAVLKEFHPGDKVLIHGLQDDVSLNGHIGTLLRFDEEDQDWAVRLEDGSKKFFLPKNIAKQDLLMHPHEAAG